MARIDLTRHTTQPRNDKLPAVAISVVLSRLKMERFRGGINDVFGHIRSSRDLPQVRRIVKVSKQSDVIAALQKAII